MVVPGGLQDSTVDGETPGVSRSSSLKGRSAGGERQYCNSHVALNFGHGGGSMHGGTQLCILPVRSDLRDHPLARIDMNVPFVNEDYFLRPFYQQYSAQYLARTN